MTDNNEEKSTETKSTQHKKRMQAVKEKVNQRIDSAQYNI